MNLITIFTPTYNRCDKLKNLYESLCSQKNKNFIWLVVDDGSSDMTSIQFDTWIKEDIIKITYIYQKNSGKCCAMKRGISECNTNWFFCVDSDDFLLDSAVDTLISSICGIGEEYIGSVFPRQGFKTNFGWVPKTVCAIDVVDLRVLYNVKESAILLKTDLLKRIDIPYFVGEKFLSEEVIYIQLSKFGKFFVDNRVFYKSEYLNDGLTSNVFKLWQKNPNGTLFLLAMRYKYCRRYPFWIRVKEIMKSIMNFNALCMVTHKKISQETPNKILSFALFIPSVIWRKIRFSD